MHSHDPKLSRFDVLTALNVGIMVKSAVVKAHGLAGQSPTSLVLKTNSGFRAWTIQNHDAVLAEQIAAAAAEQHTLEMLWCCRVTFDGPGIDGSSLQHRWMSFDPDVIEVLAAVEVAPDGCTVATARMHRRDDGTVSFAKPRFSSSSEIDQFAVEVLGFDPTPYLTPQ